MDLNDIVRLSKTEDVNIERKLNIGEATGKVFASFATSHGGTVLVGITNEGAVTGVDYNDSVQKDIRDLLSKCSPDINVHIDPVKFEGGKSVLCIRVDESKIKPVYFDGRPYHRKGAECVVCSNEDVLKYQVQTGRITFDSLPAKNNERPALLQDVDPSKVADFLTLANQTRNRKLEREWRLEDVLSNLGLYDKNDNILNNAAILSFGKLPQDFVTNSSINFSVFKGNEITSLPFIKHTIYGTTFQLIENTTNLIKLYSPPTSKIEGIKRIDVFAYPYGVLRELITNAVVHRDYFTNAEVTVRLFSNRIEITNPGGIPQGINYDDLISGKNNLSIRRNPIVAEILDYVGQMDKAGHGIPRVLNTLKESGLPKPEFPMIENTFKAIIYAATASGIKTYTDLKCGKGEMKVLDIILRAGAEGIKNNELIRLTGYSHVHITNLTKKLEAVGHITKKRHGKEMQLYANIKDNHLK